MILEGILNAFTPQKQRTQFDGYSQEEIDRIRALEAQQQAAQAGYGQQQQFYSAPTMPFFGGIDATKVSEQDLIAAGEDYKRSVPAGYASVPGLLADVVTAPPKALFDVGLRAAGKEDLARQIEYFPLTTSSYNAARQAMDQIYGAPAPEMSPTAQNLAFDMSLYGDPLAIGGTGGRVAKNVATNIPKIAETTKQVLGQGKTAVEGLLQPPAPGELRMMIGRYGAIRREGQGAVEQRLRTAERMEEQGADRLDIFRETGMQRFPDGKWRYGEIDDEPAKLLNIGRGSPTQFQANWLVKNEGIDPAIARDPARVEEFIRNMPKDRWDFLRKQIQNDWDYANFLGPHSKRPLSKLLDHPQLYEAYPGLKNVEAVYGPSVGKKMKPDSAHFIINKEHPRGAIYFGTPSGGADNFRQVLLHEIQHYIQGADSLGSGANNNLEISRLKKFRTAAKEEIKDYTRGMEIARNWRAEYPKGSDDWNVWDRIYKENKQAKEEALGIIRPIQKDKELKRKAFGNYERSFGEAEARMTQQSGLLTGRERGDIPAYERFDMPESEQRPSLLDMPGYTRENPMEGGVMDYGMRHRPSDPEVGNTLDDLSAIYPEDLYSDKGWHYYGQGGTESIAMDKASAAILKRLRGNPNAEVTIYRAVPKDVNEFNAGDWVTINREYAKQHGEGPLKSDYKIISKKVRASELTAEGNSIHEQGYFPNRLMDFPLGRPAVGASGKPTGAIEYPVTPEANQIIAAARRASQVGPRQPVQPPAFRDPRIKATVDPETGMYSPVEEALLNMRQETMPPQQARSHLINQGLSRGQLEDSGVWDDLQRAQNNNERVTKTGLLNTLGTDMPQQEIQVRKFEIGSQIGRFDFSNPQVLDDYDRIDSDAEDLRLEAFSLDRGGSTWYRDQRKEIAENYTDDPDQVEAILDELESAAGGIGPAGMQDLSDDAHDALFKWSDQIAAEQYYENPYVRYDIDVTGDHDYYTIVGNEDVGFSLEDPGGRTFDTVYSLNEAEVQIRAHATDQGYGVGDVGDAKWSQYTMGGLGLDDLKDMNYEEILIKAPPIRGGRDYVPSRAHWDEEENVIYHIRKTDRLGDDGQDVLFIEELQSDWHQKGRQKGYDKLTAAERREKMTEIQRAYGKANDEIRDAENVIKAADENPESNPRLSAAINQIAETYPTGTSKWIIVRNTVNDAITWDNSSGNEAIMKIIQETPELSALYKGRLNDRAARQMDNELSSMVPQGMFADDRWISQGLKQMLVKAAKEGKDGVAWTPSRVQVDQWSNRYRNLYETLYDKKLPGVAKKLEKEYGVKFENIEINGEEVPYLRLNKKARERIRERGMELSAVAPGIPGAGLLADQQDNKQNNSMPGLLG